MRYYPGRVWSAFTNSGSNIPIWNTIKEINGLPLPEDDWQYHVSINHTAMCENTEAIINRRRFSITSAHGYAALSYALLPYVFAQDYTRFIIVKKLYHILKRGLKKR